MSRHLAVALLATVTVGLVAESALADNNGWDGRRRVSRQRSNDLFYNHYVGPQPSGTAAQMYISPQPVPARTGHTYITYQPLMPHEFTYGHKRSYYNHHPGSGWTRTNVSYGAMGGFFQSLNFWAHDDTIGGHLRQLNPQTHLDYARPYDY